MAQQDVTQEALLAQIAALREEIATLQREKADMEVLMEMTVEHSDGVTEEMQERLRIMEMLQRAQTREGWEILRSQHRGLWGYTFDRRYVKSLHTPPSPTADTYTVPMRVQQGEVVGVLGVQEDAQRPLTREERALLEALSEQVAAALDRARLFEVTRRNAAREQIVSEISAQMRASLDIDTVLQTTIRAVADTLNIASVEVRLGIQDEAMETDPQLGEG